MYQFLPKLQVAILTGSDHEVCFRHHDVRDDVTVHVTELVSFWRGQVLKIQRLKLQHWKFIKLVLNETQVFENIPNLRRH